MQSLTSKKMSNVVLLDTGIVARIYSPSTGKKWEEYLSETVKAISDVRIIIPTTVCYEFAQSHQNWYDFVQEKIENNRLGKPDPAFAYAGYNIPKWVIYRTAKYLIETRESNPSPEKAPDQKNKISFVDATIAVYSLEFGYYIFTLNQCDFPPKFFDVVEEKISPASTKLSRVFGYLLKPKIKEWQDLNESTQSRTTLSENQ